MVWEGAACFHGKRPTRLWGGCGSGGGQTLGSCSTTPAAPFQPLAGLGEPTGSGEAVELMGLAQRTNAQCSIHSASSAKVHSSETLTALFCETAALRHSAGERCVLDLPLAKPGSTGSSARALPLDPGRAAQLREGANFSMVLYGGQGHLRFFWGKMKWCGVSPLTLPHEWHCGLPTITIGGVQCPKASWARKCN